MENHYRTLGLDNFSSIDEVKKAYRLLAKKYHPDRNSGKEDVFKRINEANSILSDVNKKALFDDRLRYSLSNNQTKSAPHYHQTRSGYSQTKVEYSKRVKFYGGLFVAGLLILFIGGPIGLSFYSGNYAYQEGLRYQEERNYREAVDSYKRAIKYFSTKSAKACIQLSRMCLNELNNPNRALQYANQGIEYAGESDERAELYFIKAKALKQNGEVELAKACFFKSVEEGYNPDSININIGLLEAFYLDEFDSAIIRFDKLINRQVINEEVFFGKAWCLQKSYKHADAIEAFNILIESYPNNGPGHYYKGLSQLTLGDSTEACSSIKKANELNYPLASKIIDIVCPDS